MSKTEVETSEEIKYAVLMETNGKEFESWYYFLRWNGNEEAIRHLAKQIESIEFYILDDLSTFDIDLDHLVSERTAKEMTKIEVNSMMFHRKFDGKLEKIDLKLSKRDSNDKKIIRCFKKLGIGKIEDYIDKEDIDPEDLVENPEDVTSDSGTDYEYNISTDDESSEDDGKRRGRDKKKRRESPSTSRSESEREERRKKDKLKKKK